VGPEFLTPCAIARFAKEKLNKSDVKTTATTEHNRTGGLIGTLSDGEMYGYRHYARLFILRNALVGLSLCESSLPTRIG
jgi:hypothetical protein